MHTYIPLRRTAINHRIFSTLQLPSPILNIVIIVTSQCHMVQIKGAILGNIHPPMDYTLFLRDRHLFLQVFQSALPINAWAYLLHCLIHPMNPIRMTRPTQTTLCARRIGINWARWRRLRTCLFNMSMVKIKTRSRLRKYLACALHLNSLGNLELPNPKSLRLESKPSINIYSLSPW